MTIKSRTCRSVFATGTLILAVGIMGFAPGIASAEPNVRSAPYDLGERCRWTPVSLSNCDPDPIAMTHGALTLTSVERCVPMRGCAGGGSFSVVGIFVDVVEPGSLSVWTAFDVIGTSNWTEICASVFRTESNAYLGGECSLWRAGAGQEGLEVTVPSAGSYTIAVYPQPSLWDESSAVAVKMIGYELTT